MRPVTPAAMHEDASVCHVNYFPSIMHNDRQHGHCNDFCLSVDLRVVMVWGQEKKGGNVTESMERGSYP